MVIWQGVISVREGTRDAYIERILQEGLLETFRSQKGNLYYIIGAAIDEEHAVYVSDAWETKEDFAAHDQSEAVKVWHAFDPAYVTGIKSKLIEIDDAATVIIS